MNRVAESCVEAEKRLGLDSHLCNVQDSTEADWEYTLDADVHVAHTHFPETFRGKSMRRQLTKPLKLVWVSHGTPEHVFNSSLMHGRDGYGHGDPLMIYQYWCRNADARVTFWDRHKWILDTMVDKGTIVDCVPMGVDLEFWKSGESQGKWAGTPSLFTAENPHEIKHPFDLFTLWPRVYPELDNASLHACYVPYDQHRWIFPWANANGASYGMHISPLLWEHRALRNVFKSIDFFIGLVSKGDHNRLSLEANAAGAKTISYAGNIYSDYWLPEGDQRLIAAELIRVLKGEVEPRAKTPVPEISETALAFQKIYERILA